MESVNIEQLVNLILEYNIEEINYINFPINQPFGLVIYSDDVKYEFIINIKNNSDKLIILGAGNLHKSVMEKFHNRPVFSRISWPFKESTIYYNDPSRFMGKKELSGGWGLGTIDHWCIEEISKIIKLIADNIFNYSNPKQKYNNLIFYGSSMAGFMSLQLSILVKNSISVAEMPQFDLTKWSYWKTLKENLFEGLSDEEIKENYSYKINIMDLIKKEKYIPESYLVLDCSAEDDFEYQYKPFFDRFDELPYEENNDVNKIRIRIDGKNRGHSQLNYTNVFKLLDDICLLIDAKNIRHDELIANYFAFNSLNLKQQSALIKYTNARIDLKNYGSPENSIELIESSDKSLWCNTPPWFKNNEGSGIILHSKKGSLDFKIKIINDGLLKMFLKGVYFRDKNQNVFPIHIDYTKLIINDETIFELSKIVWHNKPFIYQREVKNGEILTIHIEWSPV